LRIVPLGGLGEIGMNCLAVETDDSIVVVDCGVTFPEQEFGVDVIHPDFGYLIERRHKVRGVVLTHGHEDHIGAVPYLLRELDAPVYGPPYALGLVRERLREHEELRSVELIPTRPRHRYVLGDVEVEPLRVTHSIADAHALCLRTPAGTVLHSGDFRIDPTPPDGQAFDAERLGEIGREGVDVLLSDSTNVDVAAAAASELEVAERLAEYVRAARTRIVVAMFASNVHRLRAVLRAARASGKEVGLLGRSVQLHTRVAVDAGYLEDAALDTTPVERLQQVPRERLVAIATGTQGEPAAALARLASGTHPSLRLEAGDVVVLSARVIPGHERKVQRIVSDLERMGVEVHTPTTDAAIHASGHASRAEQRRMIELTRPASFVPVHGTFHHLAAHARLAAESRLTSPLVVENGAVLEWDGTALREVGRTTAGRVHVEAGEVLPEAVLRDRLYLAELGVAMAVVVVDTSGRRLWRMPEVVTRGVVDEVADADVIDEARREVAEAIGALRSPLDAVDDETIREAARRALRRSLHRTIGRRPLTQAVILRLPR
jgi:ribonuclease J